VCCVGIPVAARKENKMQSRKVVTRSGRGFRGYFPSKKLNRLVEFESILERDAIRIFENANEVIQYREQPTIIYYYIDDVQKKYYPDFELVLDSGQIAHIEVKPSDKLANAEIAQKYHAIDQHYSSRSEYFVILTEHQIRMALNVGIYELINNSNLLKVKGANHATVLL
jgi:hypothetical protein